MDFFLKVADQQPGKKTTLETSVSFEKCFAIAILTFFLLLFLLVAVSGRTGKTFQVISVSCSC